MKYKILLHLVKASLLAMLIFFSISYLFVLYRISPITIGDTYTLKIGFPYTYYHQFQLRGNPYVNSGWLERALLFDIIFTWVMVVGIYFWTLRKRVFIQD